MKKTWQKIQEMFWRYLRPTEWAIRLLKLPVFPGPPHQKGLVLVQLDGLSYRHFCDAMEKNHLSFLKFLKERQGYKLYHFYPGIPSSTPSVQGELFYGVKQCVAAFRFKDRKTGKIFTMYDPDSARQREKQLEVEGDALLKDGSAYGNIFSGGAREPHFCTSTLGWKAILDLANPFKLLILLLFNLPIIFRTLLLVVIELVLAVKDFIQGVVTGYGFWEELKFIATRLAVSILMREIIVAMVVLDIARGLPIIHLNLFGYDEQAHRRGPSSKFAYRVLKGMDNRVGQIWKAIHQDHRREYDLWIYSDHGQEEAMPFPLEHGKRVEQAIEGVLRPFMPGLHLKRHIIPVLAGDCPGCSKGADYSYQLERQGRPEHDKNHLLVTVLGPLGHIYIPLPLNDNQKKQVAMALVRQGKVPLVMTVLSNQEVRVWTEEGTFRLPAEGANLLGEDHPYLREVVEDLERLAFHQDRGTFVFMGWRKNKKANSFPIEFGTHGGPGPTETDGFALLPANVSFDEDPEVAYLRPIEIRRAALKLLGRMPPQRQTFLPKRSVPASPLIRIMSYNIHRCVGTDHNRSPWRIARIIERQASDVVALQEVYASGNSQGGKGNQAQWIADYLGMECWFEAVHQTKTGIYGNAILSRYPIRRVRTGFLKGHFRKTYVGTPRGVMWAEIVHPAGTLQVVNTHLSFIPSTRNRQLKELLKDIWLSDGSALASLVVCGDFNMPPHARFYRPMAEKLQDVQSANPKPAETYPSFLPLTRIDHIFAGPGLTVVSTNVPTSRLERRGSDHLPVVAEMTFRKSGDRYNK